jgi:hypothetical protein
MSFRVGYLPTMTFCELAGVPARLDMVKVVSTPVGAEDLCVAMQADA